MSHICDKCGKGFQLKTDLGRHMKIKNNCDKKQQICKACNGVFVNFEALKKHKNRCEDNANQEKAYAEMAYNIDQLDKTLNYQLELKNRIEDTLNQHVELTNRIEDTLNQQIELKNRVDDNLNQHIELVNIMNDNFSICFGFINNIKHIKGTLNDDDNIPEIGHKIKTLGVDHKMKTLGIDINTIDNKKIVNTVSKNINSNNTSIIGKKTKNNNIINIASPVKTVVINLCSFGKENPDDILSEKSILQILKRGLYSVVEYTLLVHFDKDRPEYHNIYVSNINNIYINVFQDGEWHLKSKSDFLSEYVQDKLEYIMEKYEEYYEAGKLNIDLLGKKDKFSKAMKAKKVKKTRKGEVYEEGEEGEEFFKKVERLVYEILYDKRKMAMETRKKIEK